MKILIIEDEPSIRDTLRDLLELNDHTVLAAGDGPEGIALAADRPDLILCDIGLPGMDGYEVISALRRLPACQDIPFVFLTARAERDDQRRGMALGADDYITKPFTERDILDSIAARVRRQQPLRDRVEQLLTQRRTEVGANWSHELMTPLNGVLGGLELIEAEADTIEPGELKSLLGLIRAGAERQHTLSKKRVLYVELEGLKAAPPSAGTVRCAAAVSVAAGAAQAAQAERRTADLTVRCDPGHVPGYDAHLTAAVAEVVGNAFHFSPPGQPVTVTGTCQGGRYRIEIVDHGPGMTAEQRANVTAFKQFHRNHSEQQGLGLGLAIARATADLAGGRFFLTPAAPESAGLRATFDLPLLAPA